MAKNKVRVFDVKVTHPLAKEWKSEVILRELIERATDLIIMEVGKKFDIVMARMWTPTMEGKPETFAGGNYTISQRVLVCRCFTAVKYDEKLTGSEVKLYITEDY